MSRASRGRDERTSASIALRSVQRIAQRERDEKFRAAVRIGLDRQRRETLWREHFQPYANDDD